MKNQYIRNYPIPKDILVKTRVDDYDPPNHENAELYNKVDYAKANKKLSKIRKSLNSPEGAPDPDNEK